MAGPEARSADLAARVTRLEQALGEAGSVLARAGDVVVVDASSPRAGRGTPTTAVRKGVRTVTQLGVAAIPGVIVSMVADVSPEAAGWVTVAIAPLVTFAQNELEDRLILPAFLREPSPKGPRAAARAAAVATTDPDPAP